MSRTGPTPRSHLVLRSVVRTSSTVVGIVVLYYVLPLQNGFGWRTVLSLVGGLIGVGLLVAWQVRGILRSDHPAVRAVEGLALTLPLFLLLFAAAYAILGGSDPQAFTEPLTRTDTLYFVVTVFATVGFGDIAPVSEVARVLTMGQMLGDLLLVGLVLRVVLSAVDRGRQRVAVKEPSPDPSPDGTPRR
jgi:hypothetical protein